LARQKTHTNENDWDPQLAEETTPLGAFGEKKKWAKGK